MKSPILLVDVYDEKGKLQSSNRPSFLRKQENERVAKLKKEAAKIETKSNKAEKKTAITDTETTQPNEAKKEASEPAAEPAEKKEGGK